MSQSWACAGSAAKGLQKYMKFVTYSMSVVKKYILIFMLPFCVGFLPAQAPQPRLGIDLQMGFPNLFSGSPADSWVGGLQNLKYKAHLPLALNLEYRINPKFGLVLGGNFSRNVITFQDMTGAEAVDYKLQVQRLRIQTRLHYYFVETSKAQWYFCSGIGYIFRFFPITGPEPYSGSTDFLIQQIRDRSSNIGFGPSLRLAIGARYFFSPKIGLSGEFGIGEQLLRFGLSARI